MGQANLALDTCTEGGDCTTGACALYDLEGGSSSDTVCCEEDTTVTLERGIYCGGRVSDFLMFMPVLDEVFVLTNEIRFVANRRRLW